MDKSIDPNRIYTLPEVAEILDVSERTLGKAVKSGDLKAKQIGYSLKITGDNILSFAGSVSYPGKVE